MNRILSRKLLNKAAVAEKYARSNHYNSLKVWWARRPLIAMRYLLIEELLKENPKKGNAITHELVYELNPPKKSFEQFCKEFNTKDIKVLDVFAGGGSIPFEAARLGCQSFSAELNPVASLLEETIFDSSHIEGFADILEESAGRVIDKMESEIRDLYYVNGINPYVIFWSRTARCESCKKEIDLRRFRYFAKKTSKTIRISDENELVEFDSIETDERKGNGFKCQYCGEGNSFSYLKKFCKTNKLGHKPFGICYHNKKKKAYKLLSKAEIDELLAIEKKIEDKLSELKEFVPNDAVVAKSGVINPTLYDLKEVQDFYNNRQLLVLAVLVKEIANEYKSLLKSQSEKVSIQVVRGLTSLIEFLVDWNSVATMWISQNEQTGRCLAGPGVGMKWDYIEINPFYSSGSNLRSKIARVCSTFRTLMPIIGDTNIIKGSSTKIPLEDNTIDIVLTDPPYYDSIDYTGLSEFFRPWFETLIRKTYDSNISLENDSSQEAIVSLSNDNKHEKDHDHYKNLMAGVLKECHRVIKKDGSVHLLFSHKTVEGWQVIGEAFREAGLFIESALPVEMERIARPRAMSYEALNGVIVFRAVKETKGIASVQTDLESLSEALENEEIFSSHIVIYLAALSCKLMTLEDLSFDEAYTRVKDGYYRLLIGAYDNQGMDKLSLTYLKAKTDFKNLAENEISLLKKSALIGENSTVPMDFLNSESLPKDTVIQNAVVLFNEFKSNAKTKTELKNGKGKNVLSFFTVLGGMELNTVGKRSSSLEEKVARLIVSKSNN